VSETVSRGRDARPQAPAPAVAEARGSRGRGRWVALSMVVVLAGGAMWAWRAGAFSPAAAPGGAGRALPAPATAVVTRQDIAAVTPVTATLGYDGSYTVTGQGSGTLTWLPSVGQVIRQGQVLYKTDNGSPVVLLYGSVPAWRTLYEGLTGQDVAQLNHDLVKLGYVHRADIVTLGWDYFSWETAYGVQLLEEHLGVSFPPGSLTLGQAVFEPEALRVSQVSGTLGGPVSASADPGTASGLAAASLLTATSDRHVVMISLDAADQSQVKVGDTVSVTLPDGMTTPGVVSQVGTVATITPGSNGSPATTIPVTVRLVHPSAAGTLDQAPVTVNIITATTHDVLVVPVAALLAESPGGYVVEVVGPGNTRRYVPVRVGPIFDDAHGLVQVTGALTPGQRVVEAAS
jgi:hypothetical protein